MTFRPVTHGFYRYTDIIFEWHTAFQDRPVIERALKAFISPHCVTRKEHPFNKDAKGAEFWMGTLPNGEQRLMYSSAQVEYARYWLKEMGFTNGALIPIPDSSYLLRPGTELQAVSPVYYNDAAKLKNATKDVDKNNKRLKRIKNAHTGRIQFERIRNAWNEKVGTWCAIDFEWWERQPNPMTEVGLSSVVFENELESTTSRHLIFQENRLCRNIYSPQNREHFLFGESQTLPKKQITGELDIYLRTASARGPVFLIFHDQTGDIKCLRETGVELDGLSGDLPEIAPSSGLFSIDTTTMWAALSGRNENCNLERMCRLLGVKNLNRFHNAGNDAHFTLQAFKCMAGGPPLDMQREERWPSQTDHAATVQFTELQQEGGYWSDDVDMLN